jgi:hypothetical protein
MSESENWTVRESRRTTESSAGAISQTIVDASRTDRIKRQLGKKYEKSVRYRILGRAYFNGEIVYNGQEIHGF